MAYEPDSLSALAYANGFTLWHYRTPDTTEETGLHDYFAAAVRMLREGDFILMNANIGADPEHALCVVVCNDGDRVMVTDVRTLGTAAP